MSRDIFDFWSEIRSDQKIHPADELVFSRISNDHKFRLECLPAAYMGPLKEAPVVLLFLSPGFSEFDVEHAKTGEGQAWYERQRGGFESLPVREDHEAAFRWWSQRTKCFGNPTEMRMKVAILNIGAYHSKDFSDWRMLTALPSSRACMDWAQDVLFKEAVEGKRVVVCLRSPRYWGLSEREKPYDKSLYAPPTNRAGHMNKGGFREQVIAAVREKLELSNR